MTKLKNKLWILLAGAVVFSAVFLFAGFMGGEPVSAEEACLHEYGEGIVHAPTCTAEGYTEYICTLCGESYRDNYTDRSEHSYSEVVIEPTCTHEGYTAHFCTVCGYEYTDGYIPATGHRNYHHLRRGDGCTAAHQRSVGVGRLKLKLAGVGAEK